MNNVKINNELELTYPEGFKEMGEEELKRYFSSANDRWGAYDEENHAVLSVSWTKAGILDFLSDTESVLIGAEARLKRSLLNYQRISSFKTVIASKVARGIRFEYRVNDSVMVHVADLIVFKYRKKYYSFNYITRKINAASTRQAFADILKSVKL